MRVVIIGATGHGKNTLAKSIEQLTTLECEVLNTEGLIEVGTKQVELKDLEKDLVFNTKEIEYKSTGIKPWKRNKFYQQ